MNSKTIEVRRAELAALLTAEQFEMVTDLIELERSDAYDYGYDVGYDNSRQTWSSSDC